jgi:3-oxoacyl-[acyl-carrier-protein] synthase II
MIAYGDADVMVAGGSKDGFALAIGGFCSARALSTRSDDPATASRPWKRAGRLRLGRGAGVLVLELGTRARGARILPRLLARHERGRSSHDRAERRRGRSAPLHVECAQNRAKSDGNHYINAHGTSTQLKSG